MALLDDIKFQFRSGNILMQLIYVNGGVFLLLMILRVILFLVGSASTYELIEHYLSVPSSPYLLLFRPWTLITHMFVHAGFLHILFNMLWLQFGGTIFLNFHDSKKLLSTYILGGLSGAVLFILAMNIFPAFSGILSVALGASSAVLAIMVAVAITVPNYVVHLVLIGPVKLKYIAIVSVALDVLLIPSGNAGGHFGHLGGALFGFVYATQLKRGNDLTVDFLKPLFWVRNGFPKRKKKIKVVHSRPKSDYEFNEEKASKQEQVDAILDKIKRSGYDSLSKKEKEILFKASNEL